MALDTSGWNFGVFLPVFLLQLLVACCAIVVKGKFQVELLLGFGQLLLALDRGLIVALLAFFDFIALFPDVFAIFVYMMALFALDLVVFLVFFVIKVNRALGVILPEG
jgi:hypothetical protein